MTENQIPIVPLVNPLTQEDQATLQQILQRAREHADVAQRLAAAGVPPTDHLQRNQMHTDVAQGLLDQFFPTQLTPPYAGDNDGS